MALLTNQHHVRRWTNHKSDLKDKLRGHWKEKYNTAIRGIFKMLMVSYGVSQI